MKQKKSRGAPDLKFAPIAVNPPNSLLLPALALVVLTLLAYSSSFSGGFVLDNRGLLLRDPRLHEASAANLRLIFDHTYWWPNGESGLYRPFTTLSYLINYAVLNGREEPGGYHWINFLLHAGNVLLVYGLAIRFMRMVWPAFFVAALWAVHPVLTESVTNIAGRADLLASGALLGGLFAYLKSVEAKGSIRAAWLVLLMLAGVIGAFSKESAVILPGVIVLYEISFRSKDHWGRDQLTGLAAALLPVALMLWQRSQVLAATAPMEIPFTDNPIVGASFLTGRLTAVTVMAREFALILWPASLSADYSWSQIMLAQGSARDWMAFIAMAAIVPVMVFLYQWNKTGMFFFCVGLAWLIPSSNLLFPIGTIMAERFLYLPALGVVACVVPIVFSIAGRLGERRYAPIVLGVVTVALGSRTWIRNADWKDDLSIAAASVRTSPRSFKAHDLLANVLFAADPTHTNIDRVIEESEKSRAILEPLPDDRMPPDPWRFAADCYMIRGAHSKAIAALVRYLAADKAESEAFRKKTVAEGRPVDSLDRAERVRQGDAYVLLASADLGAGDADRASDAAVRARDLDPMSPQLYRVLADVASAAARMDDAAIALVEGVFITSDKSFRQALVELYRQAMDPRSCALTQGPNGPAINPACPVVRKHVCGAAAFTVKTLSDAGQGELARTRQAMFVGQFGCAGLD